MNGNEILKQLGQIYITKVIPETSCILRPSGDAGML